MEMNISFFVFTEQFQTSLVLKEKKALSALS